MSVHQLCAILFVVILKKTGPTRFGQVVLTWFFRPMKPLKAPKTLFIFHCYSIP